MPCKTLICCDQDDFPQSSSAAGNCPVGWQWDGTSCVRCAILAAPSLAPGAGVIQVRWTVHEGRPSLVEKKPGFDDWETPFVPAILTGTVSRMNLTDTLQGDGTLFLSELTVGDTISVPNGDREELRTIIGITSDILLQVNAEWIASWSGTEVSRMPSGFTDLGGGEKTLDDTDVIPGIQYSYRIAVSLSDDCGLMEGETSSAVAI